MAIKSFRPAATALFCATLLAGCTSGNGGYPPHITVNMQPPHPRKKENSPSFDMNITGTFTLSALRFALSRYGTALQFPPEKRKLPVTLWGEYNANRLTRSLERQTNCQVITRKTSIILRFNHAHTFTLIEPKFTTKTAQHIPGITITDIGQWDYITGPDKSLPIVTQLLKTIYDKPPQIRLTCYIVDDTRAANLDFEIQPGSSAINFSDIQQFWKNAALAINALRQQNAITTKFQTILQPNEQTTFANTDERYTQQFATTPGAQTPTALLASGLTGLSAGLTINLTPTWTRDYWEITGTITDSGFSGTTTLSDILSKTINFTTDMQAGELLRIATMTQSTSNNELGIPQFAPTYNRDRSGEHWSLWILIQPLYPNERNAK